MKDIKKVTLIGLGAMGVFFAPRISEKLGADFRILADGARKERLERKGVTVNTINYRFPIITPDVEGDPADLVIIAVKPSGGEGRVYGPDEGIRARCPDPGGVLNTPSGGETRPAPHRSFPGSASVLPGRSGTGLRDGICRV